MRLVPLIALLAACGPGRDPNFHRILQFSAVPKLELAGAHVYFVEAKALKRVLKKGGTPEVIVGAAVNDFAATEGHVYAATSGGVAHFRISPSSVLNQEQALSSEPAIAVAADVNGVSWLTCSALVHSSVEGSSQVSTPNTGSCGTDVKLALDSSTAYGFNTMGEWYASRAGGAMKPFATRACTRLVAASGWVYCGNALGLTRINPLTSNAEEVFGGNVRAFDVGDTHVYAAVGEDLVASQRNTQRFDVYGTYSAISAIRVDSEAVYFVNTEADLGLLLSTAP